MSAAALRSERIDLTSDAEAVGPVQARLMTLGQAAGQLIGVGISLTVLFRGTSRVHVRARHLPPDPAMLRLVFGQAWAPAVQMVGNFLVNVYFLRLAGEFSDTASCPTFRFRLLM